MITENIAVFQITEYDPANPHWWRRGEFSWQNVVIKCDHCSKEFESFEDIVYTNTFCICQCSLRLCKECESDRHERKTIHSNSK